MLSQTVDTNVLTSRKELRQLVDYFLKQPWQDEWYRQMAKMRAIKEETFREAEGFFVPDDLPLIAIPEEFQHDSLGFCRGNHIVYSGRFVIPIKDPKGNIMGFTGYDKFEDVKYLDSANYGYKAKASTFLGMEKLYDYYSEDYIIVVEGPMCMLWLRQEGFNACSSLGSYLNPYAVKIFSRFEDRVIFIPDGDEAGTKYQKQVKRELSKARILRPVLAKDVDDSRKLNEIEVKQDLVKYINNPFSNLKYFV